MLTAFPLTEVDRVVRRTVIAAIVVGVVGGAAAVLLGQPFVAPGLALGLVLAVANHRVFQSSALRFTTPDGVVNRKPFAGSVALRLGVVHSSGNRAIDRGSAGRLGRHRRSGHLPGAHAAQRHNRADCVSSASSPARRAAPMFNAVHVLAVNIPVGEHATRKVFGLSFNVDTIWTTVLASSILLGLGFYLRARATSGVPGKLQLTWEVVITSVSDQVENGLGPGYRSVVPLAVTLFLFILIANWIEILPGLFHNTDYFVSPSADVNLTYALAALVFILTTRAAFRARGFGGYIRYFFRKPVAMFPLHIIEELAKPADTGPPVVRQSVLGRHHDRPAHQPSDRFLSGEHRPHRRLEAVRHVHRRDPGLHLRLAHHPLLPVRGAGRGALTPRTATTRIAGASIRSFP